MEQRKENLNWIDAVKAICMLAVYLMHSEAYYGTGGVSYMYAMTPFRVSAFFFVSGYLLFRKSLSTPPHTQIADYKRSVTNILYRLIIPTLIFSSIIYIPKLIFHGNGLAIKQYFFDVFGGISFWFTSALVVSQLVLRSLLVTGKRSIWFYVVVTGIIFMITTYFINQSPSDGTPASYFPWFYKTALVYTFIMSLGGLYYTCEKPINKFMKYAWLPILVLYIALIGSTWGDGSLKFMGLSGQVNPLGFVAIACGTTLITIVAKRLPQIKWLSYIGRNSIIFYFFSGVMPAAYGKVASMVFPEKHYAVTILVATLAALTSYFLTKLVYSHLSFLLDLRKLKK